jgi:two-component system response regulator DesR
MRALVMQEATERERARLSRELLDAVAQGVPAINAIAADLRERLVTVDERAARDAERIIELSDLELADIRRAIVGMSPRALDSHSLEDVVEATLVQFKEATGLETTWTIDGDTATLPAAIRQSTYRILEEALTNVRAHARADSVRVRLVVNKGLTLNVEDDGIGFDAEAATHEPGLGLQGMIERASALGGSFSIESAPGDGSCARFEIPALGDAESSVSTSTNDLESVSDDATGGTLRVFVAERHNLIRAGLIRFLERAPAIRVVGEARSSEEIRGQVARFCPDVILLDEQLETEYSLKLTEELRAASPSSSILIIARNTVGGAGELLEAGATGIIHKSIEPDELVDAVRAVANGAKLIAGADGSAEDQENGASPLSKRERGILALVASGQTNAEIADELYFATKTVERHIATIIGKLGARNRAHAAALAVSQQIIDIDDG